MAAIDTLNSLDNLLKSTREQHADEIKAIQDQLFCARTELQLTKEALSKQQERTAIAERFSVRLLTQFSSVDAALTLANKAFTDAREFALAQARETDKADNQSEQTGDDDQPHYAQPPQGYAPMLPERIRTPAGAAVVMSSDQTITGFIPQPDAPNG